MDEADKIELNDMGMQPYYITTEKMKKAGLTSRTVERMTKTLIAKMTVSLEETLPQFITGRLHLISRDEAFRKIHYPKTADDVSKAKMRLKFEELFYVQLNILRYASDHRRNTRDISSAMSATSSIGSTRIILSLNLPVHRSVSCTRSAPT